MHSVSLPQPIRLSRPWPLRWLDALWVALSLSWRVYVQERQRAFDVEAAAELSD